MTDDSRRAPHRAGRIAGAVLAVLLLHLVLRFPERPAELGAATFLRLPLELPVIVLALLLVRRAWMRAGIVALAIVVLVLRIADLGTFLAFSRAFNPALDLHLLVSGWALMSSSLGRAQTLGVIALALLAAALLSALLGWALGRLAGLGAAARRGALALCGAALLAAAIGLALPSSRVTADLVPGLTARVARMAEAVRDLRRFEADLGTDDVGTPGFAALEGRDVILLFVESYGRSFVEDPAFAGPARARLDAVDARLRAAGWDMRSAWVTAPTRGGQSWLSHATLLSGLWVDGQARYDRLMISERRSLNRLFGAAGWRTGAAMPAITLDWPEARWFGYHVTLDAEGLDYRGEPFDWVTMPDQYTLSAIDAKLRGDAKPRGGANLRGGGPVMVEAALITSHAPWTPLPRLLPWEAIGDGSVFDGSQRDGDTPREVWSDPERIRTQYALSLDYSLEVIGQWIARQEDDALFIVLGDHQPAPLLTGTGASADVPLHVLSRDEDLLDLLPATLFGPGMIPEPDRPALPMQAFRALMATAFEAPPA